jgi:hypothetical protein
VTASTPSDAAAALVVDVCGRVIEPGARVILLLPSKDGVRPEAMGDVEWIDAPLVAWRAGDGRLHISPASALVVGASLGAAEPPIGRAES